MPLNVDEYCLLLLCPMTKIRNGRGVGWKENKNCNFKYENFGAAFYDFPHLPSQPCFMDLVQVDQFMVPYLLNPITYGYETCTIEYSKD